MGESHDFEDQTRRVGCLENSCIIDPESLRGLLALAGDDTSYAVRLAQLGLAIANDETSPASFLEAALPPVIGMSCALDSLAARLVLDHRPGVYTATLSPADSFHQFMSHWDRYEKRVGPFEEEHILLQASIIAKRRRLNDETIVTSDSFGHPVRNAMADIFKKHLGNGVNNRFLKGNRWDAVRDDENDCAVEFSIENVELHDMFNPANASGGMSPAAQLMELATYVDLLLFDALGLVPTHNINRYFDGTRITETRTEEIEPHDFVGNHGLGLISGLNDHLAMLSGGEFTDEAFNASWEQAVFAQTASSADQKRKQRL